MWQNLQENAFLLIKMQSESLNFTKEETPAQVFSLILRNFKEHLFTEHPRRDVECNFDADVTSCITYTQHNF